MTIHKLNIRQAIIKGAMAFTLTMINFSGNAQSLNIGAGINMSKINFFDEDGVREYISYSYAYSSGDYAYDDSYKMKNLYGWNAGLAYEFKAKKRTSFETGLSYSTKGYRLVSSSTQTENSETWSQEAAQTMRLHYLSVPLTIKFNFIDKDVRIYGNFGAYFGVALSGIERYEYKYNYNGEIDSDSDEEEIDIDDSDLRANAGITGGLGSEFKNIFIEANYSAGLMNIQDLEFGGIVNKDISITIGYKLKFNKTKDKVSITE